MNTASRVLLALLLTSALFTSGCNYAKPIMYVHVANRSGHSMENLEVKYPTGSFGLPELRDLQTHRRMVPMGTPCKFSIVFEDQTGKKYAEDYDLGPKCPSEIEFAIGPAMKITKNTLRP